LVDEIGEVVGGRRGHPSSGRPPPSREVARELVRGVYKREGSLLLVLDTARAVSVNPVLEERRGTPTVTQATV